MRSHGLGQAFGWWLKWRARKRGWRTHRTLRMVLDVTWRRATLRGGFASWAGMARVAMRRASEERALLVRESHERAEAEIARWRNAFDEAARGRLAAEAAVLAEQRKGASALAEARGKIVDLEQKLGRAEGEWGNVQVELASVRRDFEAERTRMRAELRQAREASKGLSEKLAAQERT